MGGGYYDPNLFTARAQARAASGAPTFQYSQTMQHTPTFQQKAHAMLDPLAKPIRESRDSADHPNSVGVQIWLDVTGTMASVVHEIHASFPRLQGLVLRKGYAPDAQYAMCAIGDANTDRVPVQLGEFESDNRIDETLEHVFIEGGGGGQKHESYELALLAAARMTALDCVEKRGHRGNLFIIRDELAYPKVSRAQAKEYLGLTLEADVPLQTVVDEAKRKFNVNFILPKGAAYGGDADVLQFWRNLLGENVYELDDPEGICELIAMIIGMNEGAIDYDAGIQDMLDAGVDQARIANVSKALVERKNATVAKASGGGLPGLAPDGTGKPSVRRL